MDYTGLTDLVVRLDVTGTTIINIFDEAMAHLKHLVPHSEERHWDIAMDVEQKHTETASGGARPVVRGRDREMEDGGARGMSTYTRSERVVMGQCPGQGGPLPFFGGVDSNSADRMDSLFPEWREHALGVNLWWNASDWQWDNEHHLDDIVAETQCELIVGLGTFVNTELGMSKKGELFEVELVPLLTREVLAVRFPHPSGRNRFWNIERNRSQAAFVLAAALTVPLDDLREIAARSSSRVVRNLAALR